jgi:Taurine catabolism dioxygenase TauD, TfdA family/3-dehydroquinate synthase
MLDLEVPNLHELDLDRVIAYGHTWSPTLELAPETPMLHGHAVNIDMALSATVAEQRGYISVADRNRILGLMSRIGLAIDSPYLTAALLEEATKSIVKTRDGLLRAAVPRPIGSCFFINDLPEGELNRSLALHKELCRRYPRSGDGEEMLEGRTITHVVTGLDLDEDDETAADHPVFRQHPISGRTALYMTTPKRCAAISGMEPARAEETIAFLFEHSTREDNIHRHAWSPGDVVMWDNACTLHRGDHARVVGDRVMHRGMVADYQTAAVGGSRSG